MKQTILLGLLVLILAVQISWAQIPQNISYQGVLTDTGGTPVADGAYSLTFSIYDVDTGGAALWTETHISVTTVNGIFNVVLGSVTPLSIAFDQQYWLGIAVGGGLELKPRIQLTSSAYSLSGWSLTGNAGTDPVTNFLGTTDDTPLELWVNGLRAFRLEPACNVIGGHYGNSVTPGVYGATISGGGSFSIENLVTDQSGTIGGGTANQAGNNDGDFLNAFYATVGGGGGNVASGEQSTVSGGAGNTASGNNSTVGGGFENNSSKNNATVGGGSTNTASGSYSTVSGGQDNTASGYSATVAGGDSNSANETFATIGGGNNNMAQKFAATISGGQNNKADAWGCTIGGGVANSITGGDLAAASTISGGFFNTANGECSTVAGGEHNTASGRYSFAAGRQAKANHDGCFVWGDDNAVDIASTGSNQFIVRANGGTWIYGGELILHSTSGGLRFPNGTLQTTAATGGGSGWSLAGNGGTNPATNFLGTTDNQPLELRVSNSRVLRLEPDATSPNIIGGLSANWVTPGVFGATISGGGVVGTPNRVTDNYGTVGGGENNQAGNDAGATDDKLYATVGGGWINTASGDSSTVGGGQNNVASGDYAATVSGGWINTASGDSSTVGGGQFNTSSGSASTVGGGLHNDASNFQATVAGGFCNTASGINAIVPGGDHNTAQGQASFAAGQRAKANHDGAFVWGDMSNDDIASTGWNQFIVRASGGIWFGATSSPDIPAGRFINTSTGAHLTTGGAWTNGSDRARKENFASVDEHDILTRLASIPIETWNYKAEDPSSRHMGPMAQDFYAAFGMGEDNKHITTVDADGVALAAIQGLYELVKEKDAEIAELKERLKALEALAK